MIVMDMHLIIDVIKLYKNLAKCNINLAMNMDMNIL